MKTGVRYVHMVCAQDKVNAQQACNKLQLKAGREAASPRVCAQSLRVRSVLRLRLHSMRSSNKLTLINRLCFTLVWFSGSDASCSACRWHKRAAFSASNRHA